MVEDPKLRAMYNARLHLALEKVTGGNNQEALCWMLRDLLFFTSQKGGGWLRSTYEF